ncbi:class I SAM-dependent methyltransferase [Sanyastnella coralliicola]|uniref:class I SAM-dependent methyltransferase n=1 Tax=Sanyastnella coralliicola TaxID=3069118 RepID=UPI0027BA5DEE|nr:class I SAM-dependent methyltransferase [Longitalea sp. SCSIO 12813]
MTQIQTSQTKPLQQEVYKSKNTEQVFSVVRENIACVCCGSNDNKQLYHYDAEYFDHEKFETYSWDGGFPLDLTIVKCNDCGMVYQNERFTEESIGALYPHHPLPEKLDYSRLMRHHKFGFFLNMVREYASPSRLPKRTALDVGTRYGVLPELLNHRGYKAFGLEMNLKAVKLANEAGFSGVHHGTLLDLEEVMKKEHVDRLNLVSMIDVVEHLLWPQRDFEMISQHQQKGDKIIMSTMDIDSLGHKVFGKHWYFIHAQHTFYWSEKTLGALLDQFGYDLKYVHRIPKYKNLRILPQEMMKLRKHKQHLSGKDKYFENGKRWFAEQRPSLFDYMNVVAEKR